LWFRFWRWVWVRGGASTGHGLRAGLRCAVTALSGADGPGVHGGRAGTTWGLHARPAETLPTNTVNGARGGHDRSGMHHGLLSETPVVCVRCDDEIHGGQPPELVEVSRIRGFASDGTIKRGDSLSEAGTTVSPSGALINYAAVST